MEIRVQDLMAESDVKFGTSGARGLAEDIELAAKWAAEESYDAIISTDGDSDRPLIAWPSLMMPE